MPPKPAHKILLLSQVFWPDDVATAEYAYDLARLLAEKGFATQVWVSRRAYEQPSIRYKQQEITQKIIVHRVWSTGFSKKTLLGRAINFFTFNLAIFSRLLLYGYNYELYIGLSSPPFLCVPIALAAHLWKKKFYFWNLDLQPELAIASGLLSTSSFAVKFFKVLMAYTYHRANKIMVLDHFMQEYLSQHYNTREKTNFLPLWPLATARYTGEKATNPFRLQHKLMDKLVVMYAGNHALVHPLHSLLEAAWHLRSEHLFHFVFVGSGVRKAEVSQFAAEKGLNNILQLDFLPRELMHISLAAADLQVVILGENMVGFTHPQKIYGALYAAKPVLYIGPTPSHISEILPPGNLQVHPTDLASLIQQMREFSHLAEKERQKIGQANLAILTHSFNPATLKQSYLESIESLFKP